MKIIIYCLAFWSSAALAVDTDQHGNSGVFVDQSKSGMKVDVGTNNTIICQSSLLSAAQGVGIGNGLECLRFGSQSTGGTNYLPIGDVSSFVNFAQYFNSGRNGKTLCQIASSPWGEWQPTGEIPTQCGVHDYEAQRTCTQRPFDCDGTCPEPPTETSTVSIDNGDCEDCTDPSIYYTDTGIEANAYAATCPEPQTFLATNCEGDKEEFPCEMAACDADNFSMYQARLVSAYAPYAGYNYWVNECGEYQEQYLDDGQLCQVTGVDVHCWQEHDPINETTFPVPQPDDCIVGDAMCQQY